MACTPLTSISEYSRTVDHFSRNLRPGKPTMGAFHVFDIFSFKDSAGKSLMSAAMRCSMVENNHH
jgi:hypothetical protein